MKRIVALVVAAAGAAVITQRWQARQAEQALWAEITDPAPRATPATEQQKLVEQR